MKAKLLTLLFLCLLLGGGILYDYSAVPPQKTLGNFEKTIKKQEAKLAPVFPFQTLDGRIFESLEALEEPVIILNFWASWCVPCVVEMPDMLELVKEFKGQVALVAVSIDGKKSDVEGFKTKLSQRFGDVVDSDHVYWVWDENKDISLKKFNVIKVPETILLDQKRGMLRKIVGEFDWKGQEIRKNLLKIL
ncbi:MAG: TlpA disulfide reductase family protein [Alphaproteobacteria bacterium]|nr:TlpA disulfide reductase family protein [Alphaproteobacteria bacterium]MDD9920157.1 TlpA disulfide reductase family protein [Alphaproteobacteria bacterium]